MDPIQQLQTSLIPQRDHLNSIQIESKHGYQYLTVHTRLSQFDTKLNPIDTISSAYRFCT
jgi:hypothetical protein